MPNHRIDHGPDIIHFTKGSSSPSQPWDYENSYQKFKEIIESGHLRSTINLRLGSIASICFTEAPFPCLTQKSRLDRKYFTKYSPFGFLFSKEYIYGKGGMPVVYVKPDEFEATNENINWRSVRYNPEKTAGIWNDFTFEREWRIKLLDSILPLEHSEVKLVFPSVEWAERFRDEHDEEHEDENCGCKCTRHCMIVDTQSYYSKDHNTLEGSCYDSDVFPWVLLSMDCDDIPSP